MRSDYLPTLPGSIPSETLASGPPAIETPRLTAAALRAAVEGARQAAATHLRRRTVDELLAVVDRVVVNWLQPTYPARQQAEQALPAVTGFSAQVVRRGLPLLLEPLRGAAIRSLLDMELGDHRVLDGWQGARRAAGPGLIAHVLAGNIPGLAAAPMLLSLALKSAVLIKPAAGDLVFPALLARSIADVDPAVAQCVVVAYWRGGTQEMEAAAFAQAGRVVASGSDAAIAALSASVPARLIGHGHKISFAAIGRERLDGPDAARALARRLAYDVSLWDQYGCVSPQVCYIEDGGAVAPLAFAEHLAAALSSAATELPPRQLGLEDRARILRFRQEAEWRAHAAHLPGLLASPGSTDWSISVEEGADLVPTCLNRCLRLKIVPDLMALPAALAAHRRHLECAGVAVDAAREAPLSERLAQCGVHRICSIGAMQRPTLAWRQSGRPRVADWVEWTTVDGGDRMDERR